MKIKHYISVAMLALVGAAFTGCDGKEDPTYDPAATPADAQRVFFAKPSMSQIVTEDATSFNVPVYRPENASTGELTVELTTTDNAGIFTVPATVTFAAGSNSAQIPVHYDAHAMTPNKVYPVVIAVDEANADEYGIAEITVNINFEQMTEWALFGYDPEQGRNGYGVWTLGSPFSGFFMNMRVFERHIPTNPKQVQYAVQLNIPGNLEGTIEESDIDTSNTDFNSDEWVTAISMSSNDGGKTINIPVQQCVFNSTVVFGEASVLYPSSFPNNQSYFDEVSGTFFLNLMYADDEGAWNPAINPIALYGYADTNVYTLNVTNSGQVNIAEKDYQIIGITFSETIDYVDYTVVKGELTEEEVAAVAEKMQDPEQTEYEISTVEEVGNVSLSFPSSDTYTLVAVGYHTNNKGEDEAKATASVTFDYETFNPYFGWTPIKEVAYTDNLIASLFDGLPSATYNVEVAASDEYEGLYRITNPYANYPYLSAIGATVADFGCIEIEAGHPDMVYFPLSDAGINIQGMDITMCSYSYYLLANGTPAAEIPAALWGKLTGSTVSLAPLGGDETFNWIIFGNGSPMTSDVAFSIDLNGEAIAPAAKPAKVSALGKMAAKAFGVKNTPVFPARYTAKFQSVKSNGKVTLMKGAVRH